VAASCGGHRFKPHRLFQLSRPFLRGIGPPLNQAIFHHIQYSVDYVRGQGIVIPDEFLSQVAPLPWAHIALTGDYLWNEIDRPLERFRPIRANRFNPNNFKFP
jgi:hypothetical protein